jgi:hypothetical protein
MFISRLALALLVLLVNKALAISYTVQVAALTDGEAARHLLRSLYEQGFPAYSVSLPTESGQVYRLRVGAFANRAAAARYAELVESVIGGPAVPALAEDMPLDIVPLEPTLLQSYPLSSGTEVELVGWGDAVVLRVQPEAEEAEYRVLTPELRERAISAWRFVPLNGDVFRVFSFALWPPGFEDLSADARRFEEELRLAAVAQSLGLSAEALQAYVLRRDERVPVLVLAERWRPQGSERLPALGDVSAWNGEREGPPIVWLEEEPQGLPLGDLAPLFSLSGEPGSARVGGEGWRAARDGDFTRLTVLGESNRSWRALAGYPIWAQGEYLLAYHEGEILLYLIGPP